MRNRVATHGLTSSCAGWRGAVLAGLLLAAAVGKLVTRSSVAFAAGPGDAPATGPADTASATAAQLGRHQTEQLIQTLLSDASPQRERDEAARRLSVRQDEASRTALLSAIQSASPGAQLAVARALADMASPDPRFADALFPVLEGDRPHAEAAGNALALLADSPDVLKGLLDVLSSPNYSDATRAAAARALGSVIQQRVAAALVARVLDSHEHQAVRDAAGAALAELTGLPFGGSDPQAVALWWQQAQQLKETDFREAYLPAARRRTLYERHRLEQLIRSLQDEFDTQFHAASAQGREALLTHLLGAEEPEFRAAGAWLVERATEEAIAVPTSAREQVRNLVGDASPSVRAQAADALARLNDPQALDVLLAQLQVETDPSVRAALALALAPIGDVRAEPTLERLLGDDQPDAVAEAAAHGLEGLGPALRRDHPNDAAALARELRDVLKRRTSAGGHEALRAALVGAIGPLKDQEVLQDLILNDGVLNAARESDTVRKAAVRALGELDDQRFADTLGRAALEDPSPGVRETAVKALQNNPGAAEQAESIFDRLTSPATEADPDVREAAWQMVQGVLNRLDPATLAGIAQTLKDRGQIDRQVVVLQEIVKQLSATNNQDDLPTFLLDLGTSLMSLDRFNDAVPVFEQALKLTRQPVMVDQLGEYELEARLRTGNYVEAMAYASELLREKVQNQQHVGDAIKKEIDRLVQTGRPDNIAAARDLVNQAMKLDPPLQDPYRSQVQNAVPAQAGH
jgi:HEAT repeat protein